MGSKRPALDALAAPRGAAGIVALLVCGLGLAAPRVEFVSPRHLATALGPTRVELRVEAPPGVAVDKLVLLVDGQPLAEISAAPWSATWNAGDGSRGHRLEAILHLADGTRTRAVIRTSALRIDEVEEVDLVSLYPVVRDPAGSYVTDLSRADFRVVEDGVEQVIRRFSTEGKPLRVAIVLDTSESMNTGNTLDSAQKAALAFLDVLRGEDRGMLVTFNDSVRVAQELTQDPAALATAIRRTEAFGGTALYDAVWRTSKRLGAEQGRRVLVLLSDGRDEAANGFEPGSLHNLEEALDQALRNEVMVFAIGLGRRLDQKLDFDRRFTLEQIIRRLGSETGGRALFSARAGRLLRAFREVADDLRHQYSIAYTSANPARDGGWRSVEVSVPGRDLQVVARRGYFAPGARTDPTTARTR